MRRLLALTITSAFLACCGGGEASNSGNQQVLDDYSKIRASEIEPKVLKPATAEELATHIKNGFRFSIFTQGYFVEMDGASTPTPAATPAPEPTIADSDSAEANIGNNFSETNTHVNGVDEADLVKYDGEHLFLATPPEYSDDAGFIAPGIRIMATDPVNAGISQISEIKRESENFADISELYLRRDDSGTHDLVTVGSSWYALAFPEPTFATDAASLWPYPNENRIHIDSYNVEDPGNPDAVMTLEIDGWLQGSRKIGNRLYLVTLYTPGLPDIQQADYSPDLAERNEEIIADTPVASLLPTYTLNGGEPLPLVSPEDCLVPVEMDADQGYQNLVNIVAIDLESHSITSARCLNTQVGGIYMNENNLYIGGSSYPNWQQSNSFTVIHKFELNQQIDYRSTGIVPGTLGWTDPSFRMDEYDNALRVVTTSRGQDWNDFTHSLHILADDPDSDLMQIIAQLPNDGHPEPIGKPGEDIFAVRFFNDQAYVVTFERTDPLYVLDLAEHEPSIAGELEVPGFSTYLHPVTENYLLGVGRDADDSGVAGGIKVSLFDISNTQSPSLIHDYVFGGPGSSSSALYDLRALSFLATNDDQLRFTLPINSYNDNWQWQDQGLHLFEVNGLSSQAADLFYAGSMLTATAEENPNNSSSVSYYGVERSVLHDEAVYFVQGDDIWSAFWSSPEALMGPH